MAELFFVLIIVLVVSGGVVLSVFLIRKELRLLKERKEDEPVFNLFQQELKEIREKIEKTSEKNIESLQKQLNESGKIVRDVTSQLEKIHSDHQHVLDVKSQLGKLTDVLANPKQRGILGEYFLETLLKNVFQPNQYKLQYQFKDGEIVDAVIFIKDKIVPIDSKFSLENYNKILEEKEPEKREKLEKIFKQDIKTRIEETAKYIRPDEGTMDFAFMFIPSEGIYYDLLINQIGAIKITTYDLIEYAFKEKHVIIVSPTSFYAYLQTVLQGLRALQIEESAKQIGKQVENLQKHLLNYDSFLQRLGNNISTTVNTYNQAYKEFGKIDKDVAKITKGEKKVEPLQIEKPEQ
ncbi:DNA recombination protein RmuC [Candidatus Parcubacteria bacterium]|nr:DNA recombination protein RmuC [Candidatus Parcubacteria bacterium]